MQEDPAAILDIKEDIRDECLKLGPVTNVVLFDKEPGGVASVRYNNAEAATACVNVPRPFLKPTTVSVGANLCRSADHTYRQCMVVTSPE
jgi:hypothetical protein